MQHEKLICYQKSLGVVQELGQAIQKWPKGQGYLADQTRRALASILLNTAEGNAKTSTQDRRRFFQIARASAAETSACLDVAQALGFMSSTLAIKIKSVLREVYAILSALR